MREIKLYGEIGERFGSSYVLDVKSPAEAIRALCVLLKGFEKYLLESTKRNVGFKVFEAENQLDLNELKMSGTGAIKIVPVVCGGSGQAKILVGAALIAASIAMTSTGFGAGAAPYVMNAGIALALGGAVQLLAGKPNVPELSNPEDTPSYVFSGAVNTTAQGHPVPLLYGRLICGSAVISAGIVTHSLPGMAGYIEQPTTHYVDVVALYTIDRYQTDPPSYWTEKTLISHTIETGSDPDSGLFTYDKWVWRFSWTEIETVLRPV